MTPIIFLDIDGVLNDHQYNPVANSSGINRECVDNLNRITGETGAELVISSAWRYMVLNGAMTRTGFEYMLRTHGVHATVIDVTMSDEDAGWNEDENQDVRGIQILRWLSASRSCGSPVTARVAIDDIDLGITEAGIPLIQTDGRVGLTALDAERCIEELKRQMEVKE